MKQRTVSYPATTDVIQCISLNLYYRRYIWLIIFGGVSKTKKSPSLTSMEMISSYSSRFIRFIYMLLLSSKYGISFELFVANCRWLQRQLYMKGRISQTSPGGINEYPEPRLLNCCCVNWSQNQLSKCTFSYLALISSSPIFPANLRCYFAFKLHKHVALRWQQSFVLGILMS